MDPFELDDEFVILLDKYNGGMKFNYLIIDQQTLCPKVSHVTFARLLGVKQFAACVFKNALYVTGGYDATSRKLLNDVIKFNPSNGRWSEMTPIKKSRAEHCACATSSMMMVFGGRGAKEDLDQCEVYEPLTDQWHTIALLPQPRIGLAATVCDDVIYTCGGVTRNKKPANNLWTFQKFWPNKQKLNEFTFRWSTVDGADHKAVTLPEALHKHGMTSRRGRLYVVGGEAEGVTLDGVELAREGANAPAGGESTGRIARCGQIHTYTLKSRKPEAQSSVEATQPKWRRDVPDMPTPRAGAALLVIGSRIYLIGGHVPTADGPVDVRDVIYYHTKHKTWHTAFSLDPKSVCTDVTAHRIRIPPGSKDFRPWKLSNAKWALW